jgi:MFS family permease
VIPLAMVFVYYLIAAKDSPDQPQTKSLAAYAEVLKHEDAWWFMLFYGVTFGGFVGLSNSLSIWFTDSFALTPVVAGYCTAACVFTGSLLRPLGGALADKVGGTLTLTLVYIVAALVLAMISIGPATLPIALMLFVVVMGTLGIGNGAVFQLVPQRFRSEIGVMTGLVGFAGGVGGFYLASSLGFAQKYTGSSSAGFLIFAGLAVVALAGPDLRQGPLAQDLGRARLGAHLIAGGEAGSGPLPCAAARAGRRGCPGANSTVRHSGGHMRKARLAAIGIALPAALAATRRPGRRIRRAGPDRPGRHARPDPRRAAALRIGRPGQHCRERRCGDRADPRRARAQGLGLLAARRGREHDPAGRRLQRHASRQRGRAVPDRRRSRQRRAQSAAGRLHEERHRVHARAPADRPRQRALRRQRRLARQRADL